MATTLTVVGAFLIFMSAVSLFLILIDRPSHEYFFALSGSMEPAFSRGACLKVKLGVRIDEIYVAPKPDGDIIAFHKPTYPSDIIIHRAIESGMDTSYYLVTRGDANPGPDGWRVRQADLVGKVVEINPPFWTYNYIFWGALFAIGVAIMLGGVVVRKRKRAEVSRGYKAVKTEAAAKPVIVEAEPKRKFFCRYCGAENKLDASYCEACGKKL